MKFLKSIFGIFLIFVVIIMLSFFNIFHQKLIPYTDNPVMSGIIYILIFGIFIGTSKSIWSNLIVWKDNDKSSSEYENNVQNIDEDIKENLKEYKEKHQTRKNQTMETTPTSTQSTTVKENIDEDALYEEAMSEIENDTKVKSLWAKAFAKSEGNKEKTKALYIQYRVENLKNIYEEEKQQLIKQKEIMRESWLQEVEQKLKVFLKEHNLGLAIRISYTKIKASNNTPFDVYIEYTNNQWNIVDKILYK